MPTGQGERNVRERNGKKLKGEERGCSWRRGHHEHQRSLTLTSSQGDEKRELLFSVAFAQ